MVFEKIVVDILNKYLGDFIENLDSKQLSIGVWGGDVVLKDLKLKHSALDDLDLPVQTVYGRIGTLTLKIPWKDPYNSPIEASVDGLFLLSRPITEIRYDPVKEERNNFQAKQAELLKLEEIRQKQIQKDKPKADPGFVEKLSAQIIKNLQVYVRNIHIRYEDAVTYSDHFFSAGITLGSLIVVTTDAAWKVGITKDISKFFKILEMEGLAVYWNYKNESYIGKENIDNLFQNDIATKTHVPDNYSYILGPINSVAKLTLNQKPELDTPSFSIPKVQVFLEMEKLAVGIDKEQYQGIIALADSMDRMNKGLPYRKYRPHVPYKDHFKDWWLFAYKCIVETEVKRKKDNWDWVHILTHRKCCREYATLYQQKLQTKKLSSEAKENIEKLEKHLDLVNLIIIRRKIEMEVSRTTVQEKETSWFGWAWGSATVKEESSSSDILQKFENAMTSEEKERLYAAIDYQENAVEVDYPEEYVATSCKFVLYLLEIQIKEDSAASPVLNIQLNNVNCSVDLRPGANAMKLISCINNLNVDGLEQENGIAKVISANLNDQEQLISFLFETNPLDSKCKQRLGLTCKPLNIIYDALSVNNALQIFKAPESSALEQLSEATANSLNNVKQMTATGLQHAIEKHGSMEIEVDIHAPYIIVPYGGVYTGNENVLVINLGRLKLSTTPRSLSKVNVRTLHDSGTDETDILHQMIDQSYDKFDIVFTDLQVVLAQSGEDWKHCLNLSQETPLHILNPLTLKVTLEKCLITDDPRLPLIKIKGELPSISLKIVNSKLILLMTLISSIPFPENETAALPPKASDSVVTIQTKKSATAIVTQENILDELKVKEKSSSNVSESIVQFTKLKVYFVMNSLSIDFYDQEFSYSESVKIGVFEARSLEIEFIQKTFIMFAGVKLKSIQMNQFIPNEVSLLHTQSTNETEAYIINVEYLQVEKVCPEFKTIYNSCESKVTMHFATLTLLLHLEALKSIMKYATDLQSQIEEARETVEPVRSLRRPSMVSETISYLSLNIIEDARKKTKKRDVNAAKDNQIQLMLTTALDEFTVKFSTTERDISTFSLKGLNFNVTLRQTRTEIEAFLADITVMDLRPNNKYNKIIRVLDSHAVKAKIIIYDLEKYNLPEENDISIYLYMGQMRVVFLNYFISNLLNFLDEFQTAQLKIIEASREAAKQAKTQMQAAYEKETRLKLNIDINAPDIIIPSNSHSSDIIWLDLGHIIISNSFKDLCVKHESGSAAVLEELVVTLNDFMLLRGTFLNEDQIDSEQVLLKPFNMVLFLKRNLSKSWYKDIPEMELNLTVPELSLVVCRMDYTIIMSVLEGNFAEGMKKDDSKLAIKEKVRLTSVNKSTVSAITWATADIPRDSEDDEVTTFLNFNIRMERFIISVCASSALDGIGKFYLEGLSIKGKMLSNNVLAASLLLVNCIIEDTREGREDKLNNLMYKKTETNTNGTSNEQLTKSMIDLVVQQRASDTFVDLKIYSFNLILCMDFLMALSSFFTKAESNQNQIKDTSVSQAKLVSSTTKIEKGQSNMTINIKLEQPDIVLVEHMESIDTKAMILNSEISLKVRLSEDEQMISGSIKDFTLYTCCYNPAKREETKNYVLFPVNISIAGSAPENAGLHIEVCITQVKLSISPTTIELLSRCHATMVGYTAAEEEKKKAIEEKNLWESEPFNDSDYWFLKPDDACDVIEMMDLISTTTTLAASPLKEMCIVRLPSLVIMIETGYQKHALPMLILESSFQMSVSNWSSQMSVESTLNLQMAYYNSRLALWEPLIEPVNKGKDNLVKYTPWELKLEVNMIETEDVGSPAESDMAINNPTTMTVDISSKDNLELTVTKSCLEVLTNLGAAFSTAMQPKAKIEEHLSSYKFKNDSGLAVTLLLNESCFNLYGDMESTDAIVESGAEVYLEIQEKYKLKSTLNLTTEMEVMNKSEEYYIDVLVNEFNCHLTLPVARADTRYYSLKDTQKDVGLVCDIKVIFGVRIITLCTIIKVRNNFHIPVEVYYMTDRGNELELISTIQPNGKLNLPFKSVYTENNEIFFSVNGFTVTSIPFVWKELQSKVQVSKFLYCESKNRHLCQDHFVIKAFGRTKQIFYENTSRYTILSTIYSIHLGPAVVFKNCLPVDIICCFETTVDQHLITPGETTPLPNLDPEKSTFVLRIPDYLEKEWSCTVNLSENTQNFSVWTFQSNDSAAKMFLDLGINIFNKHGFMIYSLYCPFWMINKTGFLLGYRKSKKTEKHEVSGSPCQATDEHLNIIHHPPTFKGPVLFSFNPKNFFGKKKAAIRIESGEWSDRFSLDVAGSSGVVVCKHNNEIYQIGVHNQLTYNGLTKQVTFTPYFILLNNASFTIECQEGDRPADPWIKVEQDGCAAFWPKGNNEDRLIRLRVYGTQEITEPFLITESHTTLLKLNNRFGGINVDIQLIEGATYISMTSYELGMAPALIMNHTKNTLSFWEKDTVQIRKLKPNNRVLYTWVNPSGPRVLVWDIGKNQDMEDELKKDTVGQFSPKEDETVYWISFLNGMQRVLLFTLELSIAEGAQSAAKFEHIEREINLSIHGIGVSLVNNITRTEIMYLSVTSTGIIWEQRKVSGKRFKQMHAKESQAIESSYNIFLTNRVTQDDCNITWKVNDKIEVNFMESLMIKPRKRIIRRTFETGLWIQMKSSPNQMQLHGKINRIQIDNQMYDCIFPVVLAPVPPPKSVALGNVHKPLIELSIVQLLIKNSQIRQFKYFKILIQEFHIKVDLNFVNALLEVLETKEATPEQEKERFLKDVDVVNQQLYAHVSTQSQQEQKSFYDLLHFSPLKIHVSFTLPPGQQIATPNFLTVLLQGLGVTLTNLQDVIFKLGYFERNYSFLTEKQLTHEATQHYVGQAVKQLYVLVFGLDVIGNPYGLVLGITKGVEDLFYEPIQGAIQGPGEFAEGLVLGMRSLFGHTVGGAAGAVSRITGAMGKGIAALTFDKEYQRRRRDQFNKKPATMQEGFARGGKGLVMGVVDGVTGVFTKPISGAKEQGVGGFFKGLGKGAVGLVTRPTAGVIDFTSGSLDAVKRATEMTSEATRVRSARFCQADGLVRPYNVREAEGNKLLMELEKGKYAATDVYAAHYDVIEKKEILLLTDKRIAYITHNDIFGGWQIDWSYTWQAVSSTDLITSKGINVVPSEIKKKKMGLFSSADSGKLVLIGEHELREQIAEKIEDLRRKALS